MDNSRLPSTTSNIPPRTPPAVPQRPGTLPLRTASTVLAPRGNRPPPPPVPRRRPSLAALLASRNAVDSDNQALVVAPAPARPAPPPPRRAKRPHTSDESQALVPAERPQPPPPPPPRRDAAMAKARMSVADARANAAVTPLVPGQGGSEVATALADFLPTSRLQKEAAAGQRAHAAPFMAGLPVGPVSICFGARVTYCDSVTIELRCRNINDPAEPCYLDYTGKKTKGGKVGAGAGGAGVSLSVYTGGNRGENIAFRRRVNDFAMRAKLLQACKEKLTPKKAPWLKEWFQIPDPQAIDDLKVGEVWEQTVVEQFSNGTLFGHAAQNFDVGVDVAGHFIRRVEKITDDVAIVTLIPVKFKRVYTSAGNVLETISRETEETSGHSLTFRFRLNEEAGRRGFNDLLQAQKVPAIGILSDVNGPEPVALVVRESVNQATLRSSLSLLGGRLGLSTTDTKAVQKVAGADGSQTVESSGRASRMRGWSSEEQNDWRVMSSYHDCIEDGHVKHTFKGMLLYQRFALQSSAAHAFSSENPERLQNERNAQMEKLSRMLGHSLPSFDTPQVAGAFGVEVIQMLTPEHVEMLPEISLSEVREMAALCGLDKKRTEAAVKAFDEMREIEADSEVHKNQLLTRAGTNATGTDWMRQVVQARTSNNYSLIDQRATVKQAKVLQKFLSKPDVLQLLNAIFADHDMVPPFLLDVACPAYDRANNAVENLGALRASVIEETDKSKLRTALTAVKEAEQAIMDALATAECDSISPAYDREEWQDNKNRWLAALSTIADITSLDTLHERADRGASIVATKRLLSKAVFSKDAFSSDLFKAASLPQRLGLAREANERNQDTDVNQKRLEKGLEELSREIEKYRQYAKMPGAKAAEWKLTQLRNLAEEHALDIDDGVEEIED